MRYRKIRRRANRLRRGIMRRRGGSRVRRRSAVRPVRIGYRF